MVQFHLITGFLGSGKTTFLKQVLPQLSSSRRVAVIQNEFAPTGIDGKELQQASPDLKVVEINNGSVFCVCQLSNFVETVLRLLKEYDLDDLFLETSGLADPISVIELLQSDELKAKVQVGKMVTLVDAQNYFKGIATLVRSKHQIMIADWVVMNKIDLVSEETVSDIEKSVKALNPHTKLYRTQFAQFDWTQIVQQLPEEHKAAEQFVGKTSEGRPDMEAIVLRSHDKLTQNGLSLFLEHLGVSSPRIKGFVNLKDGSIVSVHSVFGHTEIHTINDYKGPTELVVFSQSYSFLELRKLFKQFSDITCCS